MNEPPNKIPWHLLLGRLLHLALEPVGVSVLTDVALLNEAPKADILLLRREGEKWNDEQRRWLADGLRHTDAKHLLIEFKYSEGLTLRALQQLIVYDYFYCGMDEITASDVACFLIVASTPQGDLPSRFGFTATEWPGVYQGTGLFTDRIRVLLLNKLANTVHNAPIKCFATRKLERDKALVVLRNSGFINLSKKIYQLIEGLRRVYMSNVALPVELTPDVVMEMGREWIDTIIKLTPLDEILLYHKSDEVLNHYKPNERLSGLKPEERLNGLTEEQICAYLAQLQQSKTKLKN